MRGSDKNILIYLKDIVEVINAIKKFTKSIDFKDFEKDDMRISAVIRELEIIWEAAKKIPKDVLKNYSQVM